MSYQEIDAASQDPFSSAPVKGSETIEGKVSLISVSWRCALSSDLPWCVFVYGVQERASEMYP